MALSTSVYIVSMGKNVNWEWKWARTGVDLLVGEALGGLVAAEGVLGLVHESRHICDLEDCLVGGNELVCWCDL